VTRFPQIIFAALRTRPAVTVMLVYQALFLNVLLPGHTRGAITLDGKHTPACCCAGEPKPADGAPAVPSRRDRDHCALCQFAAGLTPHLFFRITLLPLGVLERLAGMRPGVVRPAEFAATYFACGPPASAAHV
jgi:hypothetical protein